jgi:hypothetical protein
MKTLLLTAALGLLATASAHAAFDYDAYCRARVWGADKSGNIINAEIPLPSKPSEDFVHGDFRAKVVIGYPDAVSPEPATGFLDVNVYIETSGGKNLVNVTGSHAGKNLLKVSTGFDETPGAQEVCFGKVVDLEVLCGNTRNRAVLDAEFNRHLGLNDPGEIHTLPGCR